MYRLFVVIIALLMSASLAFGHSAITMNFGGGQTTSTNHEVLVPDNNLKAYLLDPDGGDLDNGFGKIMAANMKTVTQLRFSNKGVSDLTGLEHAINLEVLQMGRNEVDDLSPIAGLRKLRVLWAGHNPISDLRPLLPLDPNDLNVDFKKNASKLELIGLRNCSKIPNDDTTGWGIFLRSQLTYPQGSTYLDDGVPIGSAYPNLKSLMLRACGITDLFYFSRLSGLGSLNLSFNQIAHIRDGFDVNGNVIHGENNDMGGFYLDGGNNGRDTPLLINIDSNSLTPKSLAVLDRLDDDPNITIHYGTQYSSPQAPQVVPVGKLATSWAKIKAGK